MKENPPENAIRRWEVQASMVNVKYEELLDRAKRDPDAAEYMKLRMAYADSIGYAPYRFESEMHRDLSKALDSDDLPAALEAIHQLLNCCYIDIHAHMLAVDIYSKIRNIERESYHLKFATGLLDSILQSGDGTSFQSAFVVISSQEEYALLRILGLEPIMQSMREYNGHEYDVYEVFQPKASKIKEVYFNIDLPINWLDKKLKNSDIWREEEQDLDTR